jgi:phage-related protein
VKRIPAVFFRTDSGREPVREWLKALPVIDRGIVGNDIRIVEFGWPVGMPTCRPFGEGLFEVRSHLATGRIARVIFYIDVKGRMALLHAFIKKTQKTPDNELRIAMRNRKIHESALDTGKSV